MPRFRPRYIFENELGDFGLPDKSELKTIMSVVDAASTLIDEYCGRTDGEGNGSLVYSTYGERILLQARNRNILRLSFKPLVALVPSVVSDIQASGAEGKRNNFYTGVIANQTTRPNGQLSPIISAAGRYGYPRRGEAAIYPDLNYGMNLLQVAAYFGGPPGFMDIDVGAIDFDPQTGELWVPAGLYMSQYTELYAVYNAGYDPRDMPPAIKDACAALVKSLIARGGVTGVKGISAQDSVNVTLSEDIIDPTIQQWLDRYKTVIAY